MKETFLLRMPTEIKEWLTNEANKKGLTLTGFLLAIIDEYKRQQKG